MIVAKTIPNSNRMNVIGKIKKYIYFSEGRDILKNELRVLIVERRDQGDSDIF